MLPFKLENRIVIAETPAYALGACITLQTRILLFKQKPEGFYIDFLPQIAGSSLLFIIPKDHFYFLDKKSAGAFICIDIPCCLLSAVQRKLIYRLHYFENKAISIFQDLEFNYYNLQKFCIANNNQQILKEHLLNRMNIPVFEKPANKERMKTYLHYAENFIYFVNNNEINLQNLNVNALVLVMGCDRQTLNAAFRFIFGHGTTEVLQWHLLQSSYRLLLQPSLSIKNISETIGFSDPSTFRRFLKKHTQKTTEQLKTFVNLGFN